jgi:hypothetical protein
MTKPVAASTSASRLPPPLTLRANIHLEKLSLRGCGIDDSFALPLCKALSQVSTLQSLNLSHNRIRCDGAEAICHFLLLPRPSPHCELRFLDISSNAIADRGGIAIGTALAHNHTLSVAILDNNHLGAEAAGALLTALSTNQTLVRCGTDANKVPYELHKRLRALAGRNQAAREAQAVAQLYRRIRMLASENAGIPRVVEEAIETQKAIGERRRQLQEARVALAECQVREPGAAETLGHELTDARRERVEAQQRLALFTAAEAGDGNVGKTVPLMVVRGAVESLVTELQGKRTIKTQLAAAMGDVRSFMLLLEGTLLQQSIRETLVQPAFEELMLDGSDDLDEDDYDDEVLGAEEEVAA